MRWIRAILAMLGGAALIAVNGPAASATPSVSRYAGADRYATSAQTVDANFSPGVQVAYVASGTNYPDGLAGGAAAARDSAPLLLVAPDSVPAPVAAEPQRLRPSRIVVLGGTASIGDAVAATLQSLTPGPVTRVAGADRYATAASLATGFPSGSAVFLASGVTFADALAASAAASARHAAILLTEPSALPVATAQALVALHPASITIVGGTAAVSPSVASAVGAYSPDITRVGGADRYATAAQLAATYFASPKGVFLASGAGFADALSGGPVAGMRGSPLLLSGPACLPTPTANEVSALAPTAVTLLGGPAVLGPGVASLTACPKPLPVTAPCGAQAGGTHYTHVIWIWMENKSYGSIIGNAAAPYENGIARACGLAANYHGVAHPSLPNYLAATGGSTFAVTDDADPSAHPIAAPSLFGQLTASGLTWRAYEESMPGNCDLSPASPYAVKHNPAAYYTSIRAACAASDVPLGGNFDQDIAAGTLPSFSFVTPNLCNDMHDCSIGTGDAWLAAWIPRIIAGPDYQARDTVVVITWDEGTTVDNQVPAIVIAPSVPAGTVSAVALDHYALLGTTEDILGIPRLGAAAAAGSLVGAFGL